LCQDTGIPIYNVVIGKNVEFDGTAMKEAIRRGCSRATTEHPLRSSVVHPLTRKNEQTSCGIGVPIINFDFDARDETVEIEMIRRAPASENGSFLQMLIPADGVKAIKRFVIDRVIDCGGRVCPPTIVGVGIGGTSDLCMHIAKVAATRPLGTTCSDPEGAKIEAELSEAVNELGIGPQDWRPFDLVPRSRRGCRHPHHDEPGGRQHPVPLGAPRQRGDHAGRHRFQVSGMGTKPSVVIPGRAEGASPESRAIRRSMPLWIPDSLASLAPRNDGERPRHDPPHPRNARHRSASPCAQDRRHRHPGETLFGVRDANLIAMFDKGRNTIFDMKGHAVVHTAPNVRKVPITNECPSGYEALCVGTTTSQRMERFTRPLMERCGVRIIIGKGGMGQATLDAFCDIGGAYLAVVGGAAALQTTWIEAIDEVDMDDLNPESIWRFRIRGFGPLLVTMDSHGGSTYDRVQGDAKSRRAAILASIGAGE